MRKINLNRFKYQTTIENYDNFILTLNNGDDLNQVDKYGETILTASIWNKNIKLVDYLIKKGVDINGDRKAKEYPLEAACLTRNLEIVQLLCNSPELIIDREDDKSLIYSCAYNTLDITKILLHKGFSVNRIIDGRAALHWAIQEHCLESVRLLIEQGAEINLFSFDESDTTGETPIGIACAEYGMSIDLSKSKQTDRCLEILKFLINNGADINILDGDHSTALISAVCWKEIKLVRLLLDYGADPNIIDNEGRNALFYAKLTGQDEIARLLIEHQAEINIKDVYGITIDDLNDEEKRKDAYNKWYYEDGAAELQSKT